MYILFSIHASPFLLSRHFSSFNFKKYFFRISYFFLIYFLISSPFLLFLLLLCWFCILPIKYFTHYPLPTPLSTPLSTPLPTPLPTPFDHRRVFSRWHVLRLLAPGMRSQLSTAYNSKCKSSWTFPAEYSIYDTTTYNHTNCQITVHINKNGMMSLFWLAHR